MKDVTFKESLRIPVTTLNSREDARKEDMERYPYEYEEGYKRHIQYQREHFELIVNLINDVISLFQDIRYISDYSQVGARIKTYSSVKANYLEEKNLDDVFGIELIGASENEKQFLSNFIENIFNLKQRENAKKKVKKDNGYSATHYNGELDIEKLENLLMCIGRQIQYRDISLRANNIISDFKRKIQKLDEQCIPENIEVQVKTVEDAAKAISGSASHYAYKGINPSEIQAMYDENPENFKLGINLPIMWKSDKDQYGRSFMRKLTKEEVLKREHPYLIINDSLDNSSYPDRDEE